MAKLNSASPANSKKAGKNVISQRSKGDGGATVAVACGDGSGNHDSTEGETGAEGEWTRNGVGRLDVRGFKELKI